MKNTTLHIMTLAHDATDEEIIGMMRAMKAAHEAKTVGRIVLLFHGYDDDPRELWDIPEVAVLCQRLVEMGFISYLYPGYVPGVDDPSPEALGASEVLLLAEGRMARTIEWTKEMVADFWEKWVNSNARADALVGQYQPKEI
jgi:hypothetical protein